VGDVFVFDGPKITGDLCPTVLGCFLPFIFGTRFGARFTWFHDGRAFEVACPDKDVPVIFRIEPAGLTTEPFYQDVQELLVERISGNPGIEIDRLLDGFSEQEKKKYHLHLPKIRVVVEELADVGAVKVRDTRVYPA